MPNCPEFLYCWFGLSILGAIGVPINTAYKRDEMAYIINDSQAVALVAHESLMPVARVASGLSPGLQHRLTIQGTEEQTSIPDDVQSSDWLNFQDAVGTSSPIEGRPMVSPADISMLGYTSGTTGNPKGVQVSHQMYVAAGQGFAHWTQATADDRFFTCLPFYHANIQYYSTMGALASGATLIIADRFSASRFWSQVKAAQATVVNFIGMMMPVLAKQPRSASDRDNHVRLFYGSPAFSPEFLNEFQDRFGTDVIVGLSLIHI